MQSPLITRKRHEAEVAHLRAAIKTEYSRAMSEGKAKVHAWAREVNYNLFQLDDFRLKGAIRAALQQAELMFNPGISDVTTEEDRRPAKRLSMTADSYEERNAL
jgi:hypothetical protein